MGIGIADRVLMMRYSYYSVISPEGCAAILWKDGARSPEAAANLGLTSTVLLKLGVIDGEIDEPLGGAHRDVPATVASMRASIVSELKGLEAIPRDELVARRREKFRRIGSIDGRFPVLE